MEVLIIVPARKNSQRLKKKNKLFLGKKNLVERTLEFANKIKFSKKIIFTSDDLFYLKNRYKKKMIVVKRPSKFAKNNSKMIPVIFDALAKSKIKIRSKLSVFLLQPTSPFRSLNLIIKGFKIFKKNKLKYSVVCFSKKEKNNNKNSFKIQNNFIKKYLPFKDEKNKQFEVNGNFYFASYSFLKKYKKFIVPNKTIPIVTNNKKIKIDIDTRKDYLAARQYSQI